MKYTYLLILTIAAVQACAADWPQFHGPNRDNKSPDKGLLKAWPAGGPVRLLEATGIGEGYSSRWFAQQQSLEHQSLVQSER